MSSRRQQGVALLAAVLVVALATVLLAGLLQDGEALRAHTRNTLRAEQAWQYTLGLEAWAKEALIQDEIEAPDIDARGDVWLQPLPPVPVPGGELRGLLRDASGCFNLNRLHHDAVDNTLEITRFTRLIEVLELTPAIVDQVLDWIDTDSIPRSHGAEDIAYLQRQPSYRSGNRAFTDRSELRLLPSVDAKVYAKLAPQVCALPVSVYPNLNFVTAQFWRALDPGITERMARQLSREGDARYANIEAVREEMLRVGLPAIRLEGLGTDSVYVRLEARVTLDGLPFVSSSVLERVVGGVRVRARVRGRAE